MKKYILSLCGVVLIALGAFFYFRPIPLFVLTVFNLNLGIQPPNNHILLEAYKVVGTPEWDSFYKEAYKNTDYLKKRFLLFKKYYMPSLFYQTDKNFKVIVLFSPDTPAEFLPEIESIRQNFKNHSIEFIPVFSNKVEDLKNEVLKHKPLLARWVITMRMDNDDALSIGYIKALRKRFLPQDKLLLNYRNGAVFQPETNSFSYIDYVSGHFLGYIEKFNSKMQGVLGFHLKHGKLLRNTPYFLELNTGSNPMWLEVVHGTNLSNSMKDRPITNLRILYQNFPFLFE